MRHLNFKLFFLLAFGASSHLFSKPLPLSEKYKLLKKLSQKAKETKDEDIRAQLTAVGNDIENIRKQGFAFLKAVDSVEGDIQRKIYKNVPLAPADHFNLFTIYRLKAIIGAKMLLHLEDFFVELLSEAKKAAEHPGASAETKKSLEMIDKEELGKGFSQLASDDVLPNVSLYILIPDAVSAKKKLQKLEKRAGHENDYQKLKRSLLEKGLVFERYPLGEAIDLIDEAATKTNLEESVRLSVEYVKKCLQAGNVVALVSTDETNHGKFLDSFIVGEKINADLQKTLTEILANKKKQALQNVIKKASEQQIDGASYVSAEAMFKSMEAMFNQWFH